MFTCSLAAIATISYQQCHCTQHNYFLLQFHGLHFLFNQIIKLRKDGKEKTEIQRKLLKRPSMPK